MFVNTSFFFNDSGYKVLHYDLESSGKYRQHATEPACVVCGIQEWNAYPSDTCDHVFSDGSNVLLSAREKYGDIQLKSERMADRWPFGRRALQ